MIEGTEQDWKATCDDDLGCDAAHESSVPFKAQFHDVLRLSGWRVVGPEHAFCPAHADRMLRWFRFRHLQPDLQQVSRTFAELARLITRELEPGPERTVALRKLLEAKDAAVRAKLEPGG